MLRNTKNTASVEYMREVLNNYSEATGVEYNDLVSGSRKAELVMVRRIFAYRMKKKGFKLRDIGLAVGGRDHTTIVHLIKSYQDLKTTHDPLFGFYLKTIENFNVNQKNQNHATINN